MELDLLSEKMKKINSKNIVSMGYLFIAISLAIFFTTKIKDYNLKKTSEIMINSITNDKENNEAVKEENEIKITNEKIVDGFVGIIKIPKFDIELPVFSEFSYKNLKKSVARYKGEVLDEVNKLVLVGHNYKNHFGKIKELTKDDYIIFKDFYNREFKYFLDHIKTIEPDDFESLEEDYKIAIITCNFDGSKRIFAKFN